MYYAGLDLHRKYFTLCVLSSEGQVVCDPRRVPADLEQVWRRQAPRRLVAEYDRQRAE